MSNTKETKACPYCNSLIDKKASLCVNCGKMLTGKKKNNTWIVVVVIVIVLFIGIGSLGTDSEDNSGVNNTENKGNQSSENSNVGNKETESEKITYISCTVDELVNLLNENALKAEKEYQDAYVEVTGILDVIDSDGEYISLGYLDGTWSILNVQCYIKNDEQIEKVLEMKKGDTVTLRGKITSIGEIIGYHLDIDSID